jgi:glycosyltransferase involved in cell wall biosynthesis
VVTLSVVIPVRDDAAALERCLAALARQSRPPDEVVVVDNASADTSADVARRHGARVVAEARVGIPAAAAAGYDAAVGDVIVRCDADSRPPPGWLARIAAAFDADPGLDALTGWGTFYDLPRPWARPLTALYLGSYYAATHLALGHRPLWGSNMAVRARAWREVAPAVHRLDPEIHDDIDLAFALGPRRRPRAARIPGNRPGRARKYLSAFPAERRARGPGGGRAGTGRITCRGRVRNGRASGARRA